LIYPLIKKLDNKISIIGDRMIAELLQLITLFTVILDPLASFAFFNVVVSDKSVRERNQIAISALLVASSICLMVLLLGENLLELFSVTLDDFRIAGGIILIILGISMTLGRSIRPANSVNGNSTTAVASIIGTPILAGPATITTIIITLQIYDIYLTGLALIIVLTSTGLLFFFSSQINKYIGVASLQLMSAVLGLVTISCGVKFIREGLIFLQQM
jgi:multiple antibiotic resistance protein